MVARESKKGEGSRSGLIVFSACVLAAWNVDEEEEEYRVFAAKWLRSWQQGEKTTKLHRNTTCNASTVVAGAFEFGATLCTCGEIPSRARLETKGEHAGRASIHHSAVVWGVSPSRKLAHLFGLQQRADR